MSGLIGLLFGFDYVGGSIAFVSLVFIVYYVAILYKYTHFFIEKMKDVVKNLETVIQLKSAEKSEISFHLREQDKVIPSGKSIRTETTHYIECSVGNTDGSKNVASTMEAGELPRRLKDLEGMKSLISEEEYDTKRQEI